MGFFLSKKYFLKRSLFFSLFLYSFNGFSYESTFYEDPTIPLKNEPQDSQLIDYWSDERMENAIPKEVIEALPQVSQEELNFAFDLPQAIPSMEAVKKVTPVDANLSIEPHKYGGKLFFSMGGQDYTCSAQLVGANNVLLTAAHCVKDENTGEWAANPLFVQQFQYGKGVKRKITCLTAKNGWRKSADKWRWDYGFMKIETPVKGGYMGIRTKLEGEAWSAMGYPSGYRNGQMMQKTSGSLGRSRNSILEMLNNGMGRGSSGGAWYIGNVAIGLNSFIYLDKPGVMWGPDFDKETIALFQYAKNECK